MRATGGKQAGDTLSTLSTVSSKSSWAASSPTCRWTVAWEKGLAVKPSEVPLGAPSCHRYHYSQGYGLSSPPRTAKHSTLHIPLTPVFSSPSSPPASICKVLSTLAWPPGPIPMHSSPVQHNTAQQRQAQHSACPHTRWTYTYFPLTPRHASGLLHPYPCITAAEHTRTATALILDPVWFSVLSAQLWTGEWKGWEGRRSI